MSRVVSWFSCGAASAVATKLAIADHGEVTIAYCEVIEEHPDNKRFLADCEKWFGQPITILRNEKYGASTYEVFRKTRYLVGPGGARCSLELKKSLRKDFERPDDIQVFGYTAEEQDRLDSFIDANNGIHAVAPLIERGLMKSDCLAMIDRAGIEIPAMYRLGYHNNNCIGCVKGGAGYWNKIRVDFPFVFERMSGVEQLLGRAICKPTIDGVRRLVQLKDLPLDAGRHDEDGPPQCGFTCELAEREIAA